MPNQPVPNLLDTVAPAGSAAGVAGFSLPFPGDENAPAPKRCFHCGEPCRDGAFTSGIKAFCCQGCLMVHEILAQNGLGHFYDLNRHPGVRVRAPVAPGNRSFLDDPLLQRGLLDFTDGKISRVTFKIPGIHCVACVWLLENLFRLKPGIGRCQVNFARRELSVGFFPGALKLSELVQLLDSIGYSPQLTLGELDKSPPAEGTKRRRWLQVGIAGFAFGNIMLLSLPGYIGLDSFSRPLFSALFGYLSLALALPVLLYSASDYWRSALASVRQRLLTLDVPIALGLAALYAQSAYEILGHRGEGYLDSLCGLVFFLLCGRVFQHKTQERLAFDRDYKCFFPLSVLRRPNKSNEPGTEERIPVSRIKAGDHLLLRNGEIIPCDATLISDSAVMDYSFVTGESEPVVKKTGDHLYAGGRQVGPSVEIQAVKAVSQSYLTTLWNDEAFQKQSAHDLNTLTNRYSRRFTRIVLGIAFAAALFWAFSGDLPRGLKAFTSVLIVACPCALALAAPFTLGTAQRLLARLQVFLKNALVLERIAQVSTIVFDKTGTLTSPQDTEVSFHAPLGKAARLTFTEQDLIAALAQQSTHPYSVRIARTLHPELDQNKCQQRMAIEGYSEIPGSGIAATVGGQAIKLGSTAWLRAGGIALPSLDLPSGPAVGVAIGGQYRGTFVLATSLRHQADATLRQLASHHDLALLTGDNEGERARLQSLFPAEARLHFHQTPHDKLAFIREQQQKGEFVMMVGDGLNDAGALKQSDVGVAIVEQTGALSPASDVIMAADTLRLLPQFLRFARQATRIVRISFGISALYNLAGISIAAAGILSPVICAVLMPLSSVSVILFACGMTTWAARNAGLQGDLENLSQETG